MCVSLYYTDDLMTIVNISDGKIVYVFIFGLIHKKILYTPVTSVVEPKPEPQLFALTDPE